MENYYEELGLDTTASLNSIKDAIQQKSEAGSLDENKARKIKSILLNELAKPIYDRKLVEHLINSNKTKNIISKEYQYKDIYIYVFFGLMALSFISLAVFSNTFNVGFGLVIGLIEIGVLLLDWNLLAKNGKASFSKWWALFYPIYLFKRDKKYGWICLIIILGYYLSKGLIGAKGNMLEESACGIVTNIYTNQFHINNITCQKVTITNNNGDSHEAIAEMSNGTVRNITIKEVGNDQIVVQIQPAF